MHGHRLMFLRIFGTGLESFSTFALATEALAMMMFGDFTPYARSAT